MSLYINTEYTQKNPFMGHDEDRSYIWDMLVGRDISAFVTSDWKSVSDDFIELGFFGLDGSNHVNPDQWRVKFPNLEAYKVEWLKQAETSQATAAVDTVMEDIHKATRLSDIEINGDFALARKKFDGRVRLKDGQPHRLHWQTLYFCRKESDRWKIASFLGYLPFDFERSNTQAINYPAATQHVTAGPYSPSIVTAGDAQIVVISGQAPVDMQGTVIGGTLEEQSRLTLENCKVQLAQVGCSLSDVFKATIYLTDLKNWEAFNNVYKEYMTPPFPARTAVQAGLLPDFLVEIEMWAAKR